VSPFDLLSEPIKRFVRDKRWDKFRPIQKAAIEKILSTDANYILASRTASGKTEAAFLPILSKVNFSENGVQVLYVSPLIALINDQFLRVEELCKYLDVTVVKWHGEANVSAKNNILKNPNGIVLITPESLEAMFVNRPSNLKHLFQNLKYLVIDEVHAFVGSARGVQLKSLLYRLKLVTGNHFRIVGLSATIGDFVEAKKITGEEENTVVLIDRAKKETEIHFKYFYTPGEDLTVDLLKDLYQECCNTKSLIFPNSRGRVEEVAVKLLKIAKIVGGHNNYFSHHSSVDKEVREYVEEFANNSRGQNYSIICTSTLELGIDIGSIDQVIQIDAAHSIASLIQRVGRSGRGEGRSGSLYLYATNEWSLIQSIACWELYNEGFIEPPVAIEYAYDTFVHQILSVLKSSSGKPLNDLVSEFKNNPAFRNVTEDELNTIVHHLLSQNIIESIGGELIIGVDGEKLVNNREFYSTFITDISFKVVYEGKRIGEIPLLPQVTVDENILLAAKVWKIKYVDLAAKRIEVVMANDGRKPIFIGKSPNVHHMIRQKMFEIICTHTEYTYLNAECKVEVANLRREFSIFKIQDCHTERPLLISDKYILLYAFTGSRITNSLAFLLQMVGLDVRIDGKNGAIQIEAAIDAFYEAWGRLSQTKNSVDTSLEAYIDSNPGSLDFSKWAKYLPLKYQVMVLKNQMHDFEGAFDFIAKMTLTLSN